MFTSYSLDALKDGLLPFLWVLCHLFLRRFGIPQPLIEAMAGLMNERRFYVRDCGHVSEERHQRSGITQGCALSPLLFVTVMSVLMTDAVDLLSESARAAYKHGSLADLAFADDTLLMGVSLPHLTEFLQAVSSCGSHYGMSLHYDKFQLLQIHCEDDFIFPDGQRLKAAESMDYLGTALSADGRASSELCRRIGMAKADFNSLSKVWKHSSLSRRRKVHLYSSMIESKLLYGLSALVLTKADRRKLDGFQARCLRRACGILPSWLCRVSNNQVLEKAEHTKASILLQRRQLLYLGKILRAPCDSPLKSVSLDGDTLLPATARYIRRIGRPRLEWSSKSNKDESDPYRSLFPWLLETS